MINQSALDQPCDPKNLSRSFRFFHWTRLHELPGPSFCVAQLVHQHLTKAGNDPITAPVSKGAMNGDNNRPFSRGDLSAILLLLFTLAMMAYNYSHPEWARQGGIWAYIMPRHGAAS